MVGKRKIQEVNRPFLLDLLANNALYLCWGHFLSLIQQEFPGFKLDQGKNDVRLGQITKDVGSFFFADQDYIDGPTVKGSGIIEGGTMAPTSKAQKQIPSTMGPEILGHI